MTLRHDIHTAIDEIAPPAPALAGQVVASLAPAGKTTRSMTRGRRNLWLTGLGRTGSLAAAILVVLLIATVVVGVRVWRDRNALTVPATNQGELARLRARPLILPPVIGGVCPTGVNTVTYFDRSSYDPTAGPINLLGKGLQVATTWGDYFDPTYSVPRELKGLVLIRIRDLNSGKAGVFVGPYAAGEVVGRDTIDGKVVEHRAYAVLDLSHPPADSGTAFGSWDVRQGWPASWSGCWGFQLDGPDFSQVFAGVTSTRGR